MSDEIAPNIEIPTVAPIEPQPQTAQVPPSEPLVSEPVPVSESLETDSVTASSSLAQTETVIVTPQPNLIRDLLNKARLAIQSRKRVKLDRLMTLFASRDSRSVN